MLTKAQIRHCLDVMADMYPDAHCELNHSNPFELVIAVAIGIGCCFVSFVVLRKKGLLRGKAAGFCIRGFHTV